MSTLLLRLAAPLQAWGTDSKFEVRDTGREPSKSGVVGLLAAALGRRRDADLSDLNALRFGVRVDQEGKLLRDFHTARSADKSYVTSRYYLVDACFLVGLEGERAFLQQLADALKHPCFPLFLGRRSCPPSQPLFPYDPQDPKKKLEAIVEKDLISALREESWQASMYMQKKLSRYEASSKLRIRVDALPGEQGAAKIRDSAYSFDPHHRQYGYRNVIEPNSVVLTWEHDSHDSHDPMEELR